MEDGLISEPDRGQFEVNTEKIGGGDLKVKVGGPRGETTIIHSPPKATTTVHDYIYRAADILYTLHYLTCFSFSLHNYYFTQAIDLARLVVDPIVLYLACFLYI